VLASPAFGAEVGLAWTPRKARVEIDGLFFPSSQVAGSAGVGGSFTLLAASASGCWLPLDAPVTLGPCVGLEVGSLEGEGTGTGVSATPEPSVWIAGTAGGLLLVPVLRPTVSWLSLRAGANLVVPFRTETFLVAGTSYSHAPSPVAGEASLGVEAHFP
jgi:hypothetical protein